jgi:hypothetical protein
LTVVITPSFYAQACAVRRAKSAKLIGGLQVTLWTSLLGRDPWPEAMVSVSIRSISPYAARTPAATVPAKHNDTDRNAWIDGRR